MAITVTIGSCSIDAVGGPLDAATALAKGVVRTVAPVPMAIYDGGKFLTKPDSKNIPGVPDASPVPKTQSAFAAQAKSFVQTLKKVGIPDKILVYCLALIYYETGNMTNSLAKYDNNYSSIRFINKPYQDATESTHKKGFAHFTDADKWAKDFKRILSLNIGKAGRPIDANTAQEFYDRLAANHYFTPAEAAQYSLGFNSWLRKVNAMIHQDMTDQGVQVKAMQEGGKVTTGDWNIKDDMQEAGHTFEAWLKEHWKPVAGVVVGLVVLKALTN